jgi:hypothetical protein
MPGRDVKVAFLGDVDSLKRAIDSAERSVKGLDDTVGRSSKSMGNAFKGIGLAAAGAFGALGVAGFAKDAFDAMADTETQTKRVEKVFGGAAKAVTNYAKTTAKNLGLSNREALRAAGGFGSLFKQLGLGEDQAAAMSQQLLQAGGDIAAFAGGDVAEVLETMSAAFRGEYDSLQKFLPTISDAAIKQQALAMTGKANADSLTDQEKAMAAFALMTASTNPAVGAAAANMGTAAGQAKSMAANLDDTKAKLGEAFGPFMSETVLPALNSFSDWFKNWWTDNGPKFKEGVDEVKKKFTEMKDSAKSASDDLYNGFAVVTAKWNEFTGQGSTNVNDTKAGMSDLSVNFNLMKEDWSKGLDVLGEKWGFFRDDLQSGGKVVWDTLDEWWDNLVGWFDTARNKLGEFFDLLEKAIDKVSGLGGLRDVLGVFGIDLPEFDSGGVVPGAIGAPRMILAHGGETVLPTHKNPGMVSRTSNINVEGLSADQAMQLIVARERSQMAGAA